MPIATSTIPTADGARLIKRLCAHWSHKFPVETSDGHGRIAFDDVTSVQLDATDHALLATIDTPDANRIATLQGVVAEHLQRMARDETLVIDWTSDAAA